jgi:MoaA/NifB/PqqE/SkfB family radical SAM enzyme
MTTVPLLAYPERIHIELTGRCNFKCVICRHGYESYGEDLNEHLCRILMNELMPHAREVELQGTGESLLNPCFEKIFDAAAADKWRRINLITNASLLTPELMKRFVISNMQLVVSLDGTDKSEFKLQRPIGDFEAIISNLHTMREIRRNMGHTFSCAINMVCTRFTRNSVHKMIDLASELNIDFLFVSEVRPCMPPDNWENLRIDNLYDRPLFDVYIENCARYAMSKNIGFRFNPYRVNKNIKKKICAAPWKHIYLYSNGDVSSCCELNCRHGNLQTEQFTAVWNGSSLNDFRTNMLMGNFDLHCLNCCLPWGLTGE